MCLCAVIPRTLDIPSNGPYQDLEKPRRYRSGLNVTQINCNKSWNTIRYCVWLMVIAISYIIEIYGILYTCAIAYSELINNRSKLTLIGRSSRAKQHQCLRTEESSICWYCKSVRQFYVLSAKCFLVKEPSSRWRLQPVEVSSWKLCLQTIPQIQLPAVLVRMPIECFGY